MFNQIDCYLASEDLSDLYSDLSVKVHGFIMSKLEKAYVDHLHQQGLNPYSIFAIQTNDGIIVRISTITKEASQIIEVIENTSNIKIGGINRLLPIKKVGRAPEMSLENIKKIINKRKYKITILTPAGYKTSGKFYNLPILAGYFKSVAGKLNKFYDENIDLNEVNKVFNEMDIKDYCFKSEKFLLGGHVIPSMIGEANIMIRCNGKEKNLIGLLLATATYTGIGGKTSLGMGGFLVEEDI